jgi:Helix-turn-helix domain
MSGNGGGTAAMNEHALPPLLTPDEVAKLLRTSRKAITAWRNEGSFQAGRR